MSENVTTAKGDGLPSSPYFAIAVLMLGMFVMGLDAFVFSPALVSLVNGLHTTYGTAAWVTVVYGLVATAITPLAGKLSDQFGRKRVFIAGIGLFTLGSILSSLSWDIYALIAFRAVQALGDGLVMPAAMAAVAGIAPRDQLGKIMGIGGSVMGFGMIAGPNIGGFVVQHFGWRAVFLVNIPVGVLTIMLALTFRESYGNEKRPIDAAGAALLTGGLAALVLGFNQLESLPLTDVAVFPLFAVALLAGIMLYWHEKRTPEPILDLRLIARGDVLAIDLGFMLIFFGLVFPVGFAATFAQLVLGMSVQDSGAVLTPLSVAMFLVSIAGGVLIDRIGFRLMLLAGVTVVGTGLAGMAFFVNDALSLAADLAVIGVGMGVSMATFGVALVSITPETDRGASMGVMDTFQGFGGLVVPVLGGFILNDAMQGTFTYGTAFRYMFLIGLLGVIAAAGLVLYFNARSRKTVVPAAPHIGH